MNKAQRKQLSTTAILLSMGGDEESISKMSEVERRALRRRMLLSATDVQDVLYEEQEKFDNMPDWLQGSSRGEEMQDGISTLESAVSSLEEVAEEDVMDEGWPAHTAASLISAIDDMEAV